MRPCRRRKIEFTNWSFELCFNYEIAPPPSPFSVSRSRRCRLAAGTATRCALAASPSLASPEASQSLHAAPSPCTHAEDGRSTRHGDDAPSRAVRQFSARLRPLLALLPSMCFANESSPSPSTPRLCSRHPAKLSGIQSRH